MSKNILTMYRMAKQQRAVWDKRWDDCQRYTIPMRDDESASLFDATAADAVDMLAASLFSLMTPPESFWVSLTSADSEINVDFTRSENAIRNHLNQSNFYTEIHQCYLDLAILGTACLYMREAPIGAESAFQFQAIPMKNVYVNRDSVGDVSSVFYVCSMTSDDVVNTYSDWDISDNFATKFKENPDAHVSIVQSIVRNDSGYSYVAFIDSENDNFESCILSRGQFVKNPFLIFRWSAMSGEVYGRSPVMRALPDIKTANKVVELVLKNATIAVSGIWQADDDGVLNLSNVQLTPGAIIPKAVGSAGLTPLRAGADFDVSQLILEDLRARIRHALLADRLSIMSDKVMTATEIIARNTDMMRILGATYGRMLNEFIRPMIDRGMYILARRGLIDPVMLDRGVMTLRYVAPIARLASDEQANQVLSWVNTMDVLGVSGSVDKSATVKWLANALHIPNELIVVDENGIA